jgi:hypothetical protein
LFYNTFSFSSQIFQALSSQSLKLTTGGSTQANESFNNMVASKAPKNRHYSSSESLDFRLGAATATKNLGHSYIETVRDKICKIQN